jgi:FkbM family methyltransferase
MSVVSFHVYNELFKRCFGRTHLAQSYFGSLFLCDIDDMIQKYIFYFGAWEPMISHVTEELLQEGDVYVDVGANIGYDSLLASKYVGHSGKVVSIEASPRIFALLSNNVGRNGAANVRLINMAASDHRGTLTVYSGGHKNIGHTTTVEARGFPKEGEVETAPIDELLSADELRKLRLVKIDVEGAELPILNRLVEKLALYPRELSVIVEASVSEDPAGWHDVFRRFRESGFNAYRIENQYEIGWYMSYRDHYSMPALTRLPDGQTDILLTRMPLPPRLRAGQPAPL